MTGIAAAAPLVVGTDASGTWTYTATEDGVCDFAVVAFDAAANSSPVPTGSTSVLEAPLPGNLRATIALDGVTAPGTLTVGLEQSNTAPVGLDPSRLIDLVYSLATGGVSPSGRRRWSSMTTKRTSAAFRNRRSKMPSA